MEINENWFQNLAIFSTNLTITLILFGVTMSAYNETCKEIKAIHSEMKDFHGRLCAIEERIKT